MSETAVLKCTVCRALLDDEDLFCPNCGTEAPEPPGKQAPTTQISTHNFECASCGASMSYDASAGTLRCPFCGSVKLTDQPDQPTLAPERVVPFAIPQKEAIDRMRVYLKRGFWRPGDLSDQALVVSMTAVYVPYWIFNAEAYTYWTADTSETPAGASGDWYPLTGEHHDQLQGVLIGASRALGADETAAICPFRLDDGVPPDKVDLNNTIFEQFSVPRKYARPLARAVLEAIESQTCQATYVPGRCRNMRVNVKALGLTSQPVLLPVWIMAYRYGDTVYRFLVNGQTGSATGVAPMSWRKAGLAAASVVAAIVVAILLFGRR